jgi:hypothetical protein
VVLGRIVGAVAASIRVRTLRERRPDLSPTDPERADGASPSGKATDFDSVMRRFESSRPSHALRLKIVMHPEDKSGCIRVRPPIKLDRNKSGTNMATDLEGGCACGQVRYRMGSTPLFVHCCHCLDCQRQTGSAFVLNALIETDRVAVLNGEIELYRQPTDTGKPHDIARCSSCGTALWSHYGGFRVLSFFRAGTLDEPSALSPDVHIYTRSKLPWVTLPPDVPAFDAYYDSKLLWPAESLARRRALFGGAIG